MTSLPPLLTTVLLLTASNVFMTFAWYGHLKHLNSSPWWIAALVSWGIALFEYLLQVPANRIGHTTLSLGQLKILQEVITLTVFVPFAVLYMGQGLKMNDLYAGLCLVGAVYFMFKT
ncbi:MAG: DMT family protein [Betaproteobacteria bacterium]|jgi:hypothetical protein|nr:DMT family protein [Betaproteobacteria bacterium]